MHHDQPDSCSAACTRTTGMAQQGNSNVLQGFSASMDLSITGGICPQLPATHSRHAAQVLLASLCCYNKMAFALKSAQTVSTAFAGRRVTKAAPRSVLARGYGADRPLWYPGNPAPTYLDGTLAGDYGFDPLGLASDPDTLRWMVHAELQNARWAMLGAAGVLLTSIGAAVGLPFPEWYEAGKAPLPSTIHGDWSFGTLVATMFLLFHWVEQKRIMDFRKPGSQGDGSFFGITDDFKSKENGYPGGRFFDPIGFSRGDEAQYKKYKQNEIVNGRLAMVANLGFWAQYAATGKGPIQNLADHLADPYHTTFTTNGVSVPFFR